MDVTLIISLITIVCLIGLYLLISKELKNLKNSKEMDENVSKSVELKLRELFPTLAADANKQLITMANEKLGAEKKEIKTGLQSGKDIEVVSGLNEGDVIGIKRD